MMASLSPRVADDVAAGDQVVHELPALPALRAQWSTFYTSPHFKTGPPLNANNAFLFHKLSCVLCICFFAV